MKIKTTIKETTEKEIEMDVQFPMYLEDRGDLVCITERTGATIYPFMATTISSLFEVPSVMTNICMESDVAKYARDYKTISAEKYHSAMKDCMVKITTYIKQEVAA